jgi:hypothetical protein
MNFHNLFKINRNEVVKEIFEISKPTNTLCENCLQGKQTRTKFKSKEYSMTKPLEILHSNICGPTRMKMEKNTLCYWLMTTKE